MSRSKTLVSLPRIFLGPRILTLEEMCRRLQLSRSSVIRRLNEHGYYSSYNYAGKFLTIEEIVEFDRQDLWACKGARFSKHGNLKETVQHFVQTSERGMTHGELGGLLGVRAHNCLLDLVTEQRIARERLGPTYVYLSCKRSYQKKQVRQREKFLKESEKPRPTNRQKIATLLELIKDPKVSRKAIVRRCTMAGVVISPELVDIIFEMYDLDKKRAL